VNHVWAFAVFAAVLTVTPGLDTMLVLRTTALAGRRTGLASVLGIALGCLVWAVAGALGVTAVLSASRVAFEVLRVAGVAYLCWLGVRAIWQARSAAPLPSTVVSGQPQSSEPQSSEPQSGQPRSGQVQSSVPTAFRTGLVTNLLNPKVGVFYLSVMPQFLPASANPLAGSLALGAIHVVEGLVWLSLVVLAVNRARGWLTRPTVKRRLEQLTGLAFLGFGLRLALSPDLR
jgi:threonine/homoserine/homoserine lactone efflux protein